MPTPKKNPHAFPPGILDALISRPVARGAMNISRQTEERYAKADPAFPKLRKIGPRQCGYVASEVVLWIRGRPFGGGERPTKAIAAKAAKAAERAQERDAERAH